MLLVGLILGILCCLGVLWALTKPSSQKIAVGRLRLNLESPLSADIEPSPSVAVVVHSFDGYRRYWEGFLHFYRQNYVSHVSSDKRWPLYFLTEEKIPPLDTVPLTHIVTGSGPWGARLINGLEQIDADYILYMQEDMWLTGHLPHKDLVRAFDRMQKAGAGHWKLQTDCQHRVSGLTDYNDPAWYIVSHQPALWDRLFFLSTLKPEYSPFAHETKTNHGMHTSPARAALCHCDPSFQFPYIDVSRRGVLRLEGQKMLTQAGLNFVTSEDQIYVRPDF